MISSIAYMYGWQNWLKQDVKVKRTIKLKKNLNKTDKICKNISD